MLLYIHQKIESLLWDKQLLKLRLLKDEEDLKRRLLELTILNETSNALSYALDIKSMVFLVINAFAKVFYFDIAAVLILNLPAEGDLYIQLNVPFPTPLV